MGAGASTHESATAADAEGVSEDDIAAHLAALDKKPCTVYYSPFSNNSMGAAMTANAAGCAELKLVDLTGEQKSDAYLAINPYGQARDPCQYTLHAIEQPRRRRGAGAVDRARTGAGPHRRQQRIKTGRVPRHPKVPGYAVQAVLIPGQPREPC